MTWVAAAVVGGAVVGAVVSSDSSRSASNNQKDALAAANQTSNDQFTQVQQRDQPMVDARNASLVKMRQLLGIDPGGGTATTALASDPGYKFGLDQGTQSLNNTLAAKGMRNSGAALTAAQRYGQDYATTKFDNTFNRLASVAQLGQVGASGINQAGENNANRVNSNLVAGGNVGATNSLAQGSIWANTGNQLAGWYANSQKPTTTSSSPTNAQLEQQYYFGGP